MTHPEVEPGDDYYRSAYETAPHGHETVVNGDLSVEDVPDPSDSALAQAEAEDDGDADESQDAPEAVDPQQWIDRLTAELEDAEHRLGPEHRDTFRARVDLATAYRQIGEPGLAVPLAVRNTLQAGMLFPAGGPVPAQLRKFQDEVCAEAGYTVGDVRLFESADEGLVPEEPIEEPKPVEADAYVVQSAEDGEDGDEFFEAPVAQDVADTVAEAVSEVALIEVATPIAQAEAVVATAESELAYEVIRLRFELQEAQRTIDRLRRRNGKLLDALREDD